MKRLIAPFDVILITLSIVLVSMAIGFRVYKIEEHNRLTDVYQGFPLWIHPNNKLLMGLGKVEIFAGQFYQTIYNGDDTSNSTVIQLVGQVNNQPRWLYLKVNQLPETMDSFQVIDKNGLYSQRVIDELDSFMNEKYEWQVVVYSNQVEVADAQEFISIAVREI